MAKLADSHFPGFDIATNLGWQLDSIGQASATYRKGELFLEVWYNEDPGSVDAELSALWGVITLSVDFCITPKRLSSAEDEMLEALKRLDNR